jgi:hypothetical protein
MNIELKMPDDLMLTSDVLIQLCELSYTPEVETSLDFEGSCISTGDVQLRLFVDRQHDYGVIAITGSNSFQDFVGYNLNAKAKEYHGMNFHEGFFKYAEVALAAIKSLHADDRLPTCFLNGDFVVTGHSLGGAAAAILPILMAFEWGKPLPDGVACFGCPNYCLGDTPAVYPIQNCIAVSGRKDVVPRIPAGIFTKRFCKCGIQFWIDDEGISTYPGNHFLNFLSYAYDLIFLPFVRKHSVSLEEHSCLSYRVRTKRVVESIKRIVKESQ